MPKKHGFSTALRILLATNAMILLAGAMLGPIYALFVEEIGGDLLDASFAGGLFALAAGITTFVSGKYSDKSNNAKQIVAFGYATMGIGFLLYTTVSSILTLFLVQILIGFGEAVYSPAFDVLYSKHLDGGEAGKEWGAWEAMNYFTAAIGAAAGGLVVTYLGFQTLFSIMAALCFASAIYIYKLSNGTL